MVHGRDKCLAGYQLIHFIGQGFGGKAQCIGPAAPGQYRLESIAEILLPLDHVDAGFGCNCSGPDQPVQALMPVGDKVKRAQLRAGK